MIHPTAVIDPSAEIADDVHIGPFTVIGPQVSIASGCHIASHVVINGPTRIGADTRIFQFCSIGEDSQDLKYQKDVTSYLEIGERNTFREYVSVHRGSEAGASVTRIGHDNYFLAYVHIAHDCHVGNHVLMSNGATLAGHVHVDDHAALGGLTAVHQFCRVGSYSFLAGKAGARKDILPYVMVFGNEGVVRGLNLVGLRRQGFSEEALQALKQAYKIIFMRDLTVEKALEELEPLAQAHPEVKHMADALRQSERGIVR